MKLMIREYLASLRERGELDAILPDLLTEMGYRVFSRPSVGTRQHGVDIGAVGRDIDGQEKVFLFSVKAGNLTRQDWNIGQQALKPSLDEILHVYLRARLPVEHAHLPVVICLTFGGGIDESVRSDVEGYINFNTNDHVSFRQWDGDHLAALIDQGPLREGLISGDLRSHLRKAVAMVEEPEAAMSHFGQLIRVLTGEAKQKGTDRLRRVRQMTLSLWIMFGWAREAENVEAPYRASEMALLHAWQLLKQELGKTTQASEAAGLAFNALVELHHAIWDELYAKTILPHVDSQHAISSAIHSMSAVDVNLKLFDMIGRIALRGLWLVWMANNLAKVPRLIADGKDAQVIDELARQLVALIRNNPALLTPIADWQAIDIGLAITFLACRKAFHDVIGQWADHLSEKASFAYRTHGAYPTQHTSYWYLVSHPASINDEYRQEATEGSVLYPMLALWAEVLKRHDVLERIVDFKADNLPHCNFQMFFLDHDSEAQLYVGGNHHGSVLCDVTPIKGEAHTLFMAQRECEVITDYHRLSAVELGHWPIVLTACRVHRLPVPPQLWLDIIDVIVKDGDHLDPTRSSTSGHPQPTCGPIPRHRWQAMLRASTSWLAIAAATFDRQCRGPRRLLDAPKPNCART
ncbi:hypothetical protein JK169_08985 [Acetobacter persici]|uniref:hypothetical protein n=1 Tax=Acetobacter persici TaxID=1076596 RepID=UPI001BA91057|nr:hypothetical protein [Acetobacter persici]MBS1001141.1 hypothetical protein [Acetobacter persici]